MKCPFVSTNGHFMVVELLLKDTRVDPSDMKNRAIKSAIDEGHFLVAKLLKTDKRVISIDW